MNFYGPASLQPDEKEVTSYIGIIREAVKKKTPAAVMQTVTSFLHAVALFAVHQFGHIETLAMLMDVKRRVEETDKKTGKRGGVVSPF